MLTAGDVIEAAIQKPAAGGRMIARYEGQVLLVSGAIPGERVSLRIDRVEKRLAFGSVVDVLTPSPDRREPGSDPLCGGFAHAHIDYSRQGRLQSHIIAHPVTPIGRD